MRHADSVADLVITTEIMQLPEGTTPPLASPVDWE